MVWQDQAGELTGFQQDSQSDREYWSSAVTQAGLSREPTSRLIARNTHASPTNFRGVTDETRTSSVPLTDEAILVTVVKINCGQINLPDIKKKSLLRQKVWDASFLEL